MTAEDEKRLAGEAAVEFVKDGMIIGLGTGSTVRYFIEKLGKSVQGGMKVLGIPTSLHTEKLARQVGIEVSTPADHPELDLAVDGTDEVDPQLNLIKGMGGALFREKIVAKAARRFIVVADSSKVVKRLGEKTPVPVEVHIFGWKATSDWLKDLKCTPSLRKVGRIPFITDNGNYILDCTFKSIPNPRDLEGEINNVPGVVDNGIFVDMADVVLVGRNGIVEKMRRSR